MADRIEALEARVRRLEDERAIRALKARYLRACDLKDPDGVLDTLAPAGAQIDFEGFPRFEAREPFVDIFRQMGCQPGVYDIHHGGNGEIAFDSDDRAAGRWSLIFHNVNLTARTLIQMGVEYEDVYVRSDGRWWIAETRSRRKSMLVQSVGEDGAVKVQVMGESGAMFGET